MGELSQRMGRAVSTADLTKSLVGGRLAGKLGPTQKVARAWFRANGTLERKHTLGLFLKEEKDQLPTLYVYIDSNALMADFTTNKALYITRLENEGVELGDIQVRLSRNAGKKPRNDTTEKQKEAQLPELSEQEIAELRALVGDTSDPLNKAILKAMIQSTRKQKLKQS